MSDDKRSTEDGSPSGNTLSNSDPRSLASDTIDWESALAACPGPLHAELDGLGSGNQLTISGDDVARRVDLIQHIKQQYQLAHVEAEESVEHAIALDIIGAILDYQVVFEPAGEKRIGGD